MELPGFELETSRLDCGASRLPAFLWLRFPHSATQLDKCGIDLLPEGPSFSVLAFLKSLAKLSKAFLKRRSLPALIISPLISKLLSMHPSLHTTDAYIAPKALPTFGRQQCPTFQWNWNQVGSNTRNPQKGDCLFLFSQLKSLKIASWKPSGSILEASDPDFEASGPRFWRIQALILEPLNPDFWQKTKM